MIRVMVRKGDARYAEDYEAWLLGWVNFEGRVMAMVAEEKGDTPWMIDQSRILLWEGE